MIAFADLAGQSALIGQLQSDFARGRYVHAYLLTGPGGTGKRSAAQLCAMAALCRGEKKPCGACGPCRRVLSGTHPDVHTVVPEKGKQIIGVGVMREVLDTVSVKSFEDGAKVILIPEAERMNAAAQNCLLKTLEEPPETAKKKARMAEGCVGRALAIDDGQLELRMALTRDVFSVHRPADVPGVVNLYKEDKERQKLVLDTLEIALRDILVQQAGGASVAGAGYAREAEDYARRTPLSGGLSLMETLRRARVMLAGNVAFASAFETILLQISEEYAKWPW